jgi:hypothetical protein
MNRTVKAVLWIVGVLAALGLSAYFAGCGSDGDSSDAAVDPAFGCQASGMKPGDVCTGGVCLQDPNGELACYAACATVGDTCKQTDGTDGTCYQWGDQTDESACMATGSSNLHSACATDNDCYPGERCVEADGTKNCFPVCAVDTDCPKQATCIDTPEQDFKVCVADAIP